MKNIKVLGTGCANCKTTLKMIGEAAKAAGIEVELEKIEDMSKIMSYGVMSTPGVVVDNTVVHSGGLPSKSAINGWIKDEPSCGSSSNTENSGGSCCG